MLGLKRQNLELSDKKVHDWVVVCLKLQILRVGLGAQDSYKGLDRGESVVFLLSMQQFACVLVDICLFRQEENRSLKVLIPVQIF